MLASFSQKQKNNLLTGIEEAESDPSLEGKVRIAGNSHCSQPQGTSLSPSLFAAIQLTHRQQRRRRQGIKSMERDSHSTNTLGRTWGKVKKTPRFWDCGTLATVFFGDAGVNFSSSGSSEDLF